MGLSGWELRQLVSFALYFEDKCDEIREGAKEGGSFLFPPISFNLKDCYGFRMYDIIYWWSFLNPFNGSVSVYIAEKPVAVTGALVFNDYISKTPLFPDRKG